MTTRNATLLLCCVFAAFLAGLGATSSAAPAPRVSIQIELETTLTVVGGTDWPLCAKGHDSTRANPCVGGNTPPPPSPPAGPETTRTSRSFTLTCNPAGGTLPLAAEVCEAVRRYPTLMLDPTPPEPYAIGRMCNGTIFSTKLMSVRATARGKTSSFGGQVAGCDWQSPPYDALLIYDAAASRDAARLIALELGLRCPAARRLMCTDEARGKVDSAMRSAARGFTRNPSLRPLAGTLPPDLGTRSCEIRIGPLGSTKYLAGVCSVRLEGIWRRAANPVAVFTETWPLPAGDTASHTWRLRLDGYSEGAKLLSVSESGAVPPQRWR